MGWFPWKPAHVLCTKSVLDMGWFLTGGFLSLAWVLAFQHCLLQADLSHMGSALRSWLRSLVLDTVPVHRTDCTC